MNNQETNIDLGPLYEPDPVSFTFDQPGWYMVFGLALALLLNFVYKWILHYLKNGYRRQAILLLSAIEKNNTSNPDAQCVNEVMIILKQVALTTYDRNVVGALQGNEWLLFLDQKGKQATFNSYQDLIFNALYKDELLSAEQLPDLIHNAKRWVHEHS